MLDRTRPMAPSDTGRAPIRFGRCSARHGALLLLLLVPMVGLSGACWQRATTGPGEIKWDRQTCERCQMVISERRHAVQIRKTGETKIHAFDDLGCALLWLDERDGRSPGAGPELWVLDVAGASWVDAYAARFESGHLTPMQYGWAVSADGSSLQVVRDDVREAERLRRRAPRGAAAGAEQRGG